MKRILYLFVIIAGVLLIAWEIYIFFKPVGSVDNRVCNVYPAMDSASFFWERCSCIGSLEKAEYGLADPMRIEEYCLGKIERRYKVFDTSWKSILDKMGGIKEVKGKQEAIKFCEEGQKIGIELYGSSEDVDMLYVQCLKSAEENF